MNAPAATPTITVIGTGYVGLTTATLFSLAGFRVFALDINQDRLRVIKSGKSFFYEQGLDPLIKKVIEEGLLIPTESYETSVPESEFIFSCVGTPDNPDGSTNLDFIFRAAESTAQYLGDNSIFVQKSTVPVGTGRKVESLLLDSKKNVSYLSSPEFLREGTALKDSLSGDRIVIGGDNKDAIDRLWKLYESVSIKRLAIAEGAGINLGPNEPVCIKTSLESAELIKVTANAFLALKISFANSIAKLADHTNADITEVMDAVGADKRIGRQFLNAGRGYGGGCFPKDVSGLISSATEHGVDLAIMTAAAEVNESMPGYIANKLLQELGSLDDKKIAVLGLAFKAGTSDARRSPGVLLANSLSHSGAIVQVFDPQANKEASGDLRKEVVVAQSVQEATRDCDAVCIATDWPEFINLDLGSLASNLRTKIFVDCMNSFDINTVKSVGMKYVGVGRR